MMVATVKGRFTGVRGQIIDVGEDPSRSSVQVEIDAASIHTGDEKRDAHLRSADFLDVENHPTVTFKSTRVEERGKDRLRVVGDLTIRGTSREVTLDTEFQGRGKNPWGKEVAGFSAQTEINRKDFGLNWNVALETGGVLVSDRVKIALEVEVVKED